MINLMLIYYTILNLIGSDPRKRCSGHVHMANQRSPIRIFVHRPVRLWKNQSSLGQRMLSSDMITCVHAICTCRRNILDPVFKGQYIFILVLATGTMK